MYIFTNKLNRDVALPAPCGAVVLGVGESKWVHDERYDQLIKSQHTQDAIARGHVEVERGEDLPEPEPAPAVEIKSQGGGKWSVFAYGEEVTDKPVKKKEAERIAADYE